MKPSTRLSNIFLPSLLILFSSPAPATAQDLVAVKAGKLIPIVGKEIEKAVILIEGGKIKSIGAEKDIEIPWDAKVIDASKNVVLPTYVLAHSSGGMSSDNERMANVPYLTVQDAVDPASTFFEEALRNGVGTIHVIPGNSTLMGGSGMVVRPYGKTVEDMAVLSRTGLKMSLAADSGGGSGGGRMAQIQKMRRALSDVKEYIEDYERRKKEFEDEKAAGATEKKEFEEKIDEKKKPVVDLLQGKATAWFYVPSTAEMYEALKLIQTYKLKVVLVLGHRCHKAAKHLAALDIPMVLDSTLEYRETDRETEEEIKYCPAADFAEVKKAYALSISTSSAGMTRYPWWQMATIMRNGVDRETALASMTIVPARLLGLENQLGSLEVGKVANLQVLSGDPLKATSWVETVLLDGEVVYERSKDPRLQHLFGQSEEDK